MVNFLGSQTSFYPFDNGRGEINYVSGDRAIAARILHVLLTRPGEDPVHPNLGIAPDLFSPKNTDAAYAFVFQAQEVLLQWNQLAKIGLEALRVQVISPTTTGDITIEVTFRAVGSSYNNVLTFGYWEYVNGFLDQNLSEFVNTLTVTTS